MRAVILGAGFGSRLVSVAGRAPKVLSHVGGETLIARSLRLLRNVGVREVIVSTGAYRWAEIDDRKDYARATHLFEEHAAAE